MSYKHKFSKDQPNSFNIKLNELSEGGMPIYNRDVEWLAINYQLYSVATMLSGFSCVLSGCTISNIDVSNKTCRISDGYILINDTIFYVEAQSNVKYPFAIIKGNSAPDIRTFDDGNSYQVGQRETYTFVEISDAMIPWSSNAQNNWGSPQLKYALNASYRNLANITGELVIPNANYGEWIIFWPFTSQHSVKILADLGRFDGEIVSIARRNYNNPIITDEIGGAIQNGSIDIDEYLNIKKYGWDTEAMLGSNGKTAFILNDPVTPLSLNDRADVNYIDTNDFLNRKAGQLEGDNNITIQDNNLPPHSHDIDETYEYAVGSHMFAADSDFSNNPHPNTWEEFDPLLNPTNGISPNSNTNRDSVTRSKSTVNDNNNFSKDDLDLSQLKKRHMMGFGFVNYYRAWQQTGWRFWNNTVKFDRNEL